MKLVNNIFVFMLLGDEFEKYFSDDQRSTLQYSVRNTDTINCSGDGSSPTEKDYNQKNRNKKVY